MKINESRCPCFEPILNRIDQCPKGLAVTLLAVSIVVALSGVFSFLGANGYLPIAIAGQRLSSAWLTTGILSFILTSALIYRLGNLKQEPVLEKKLSLDRRLSVLKTHYKPELPAQ